MESTLTIQRENLEPCQVKLTIEVPAELVRAGFSKVLSSFKKHGKVPGFRPGKIPEVMLRRHYGARMVEEARRELLEKMSEAAIKQEKLQPETTPVLADPDQFHYQEDAAVTFAMQFDIAPAVQLPDFGSFDVTCDENAVTESDVEKTIHGWIQRNAGFTTVERAAQAGDMLKVSWKADLANPLPEDAPFPEHSKYLLENPDGWLLLKSPEIIPGAAEGMVGATVGEERKLDVVFPDDYFVKALIGQKATYTIGVKEVQEPDKVQLTDELAVQYGHKDAEEMKSAVADHLKRDAHYKSFDSKRKQILAQLMDGMELPLPPRVLAQEEYEVFVRMFNDELRNGRSQEDVQAQQNEIMERARSIAKDVLRESYVLGAIAKSVGIKVTYEDINRAIVMIARMQKQPPKVIARKLNESGRIDSLYKQLRDEKVIEHLLSKCKINGQPQVAAATEVSA